MLRQWVWRICYHYKPFAYLPAIYKRLIIHLQASYYIFYSWNMFFLGLFHLKWSSVKTILVEINPMRTYSMNIKQLWSLQAKFILLYECIVRAGDHWRLQIYHNCVIFIFSDKQIILILLGPLSFIPLSVNQVTEHHFLYLLSFFLCCW